MKLWRIKKVKILFSLISLLIIGACAIYGLFHFFDWAESVHPVFGYVASFIAVLSFLNCYYLFYKILGYLNDEWEEADL